MSGRRIEVDEVVEPGKDLSVCYYDGVSEGGGKVLLFYHFIDGLLDHIYRRPETLINMDNDDPRDELIARATRYAKVGADPYRYMILREFCRPFKRVLSVGSAGYEPIRIGATHALDLRPLAGEYLKKEGWKGKYFVGSCTKLPFNDGEFDVGVCSEVIEHLEKMEDVEKAISEVNRVCKNWVITTPAVWVPEPDHKHLFTAEQILGWVNKYQAAAPCRYLVKVYTREIWHFLVKRHISQLRNCPFCKHKLPKGAWHD